MVFENDQNSLPKLKKNSRCFPFLSNRDYFLFLSLFLTILSYEMLHHETETIKLVYQVMGVFHTRLSQVALTS